MSSTTLRDAIAEIRAAALLAAAIGGWYMRNDFAGLDQNGDRVHCLLDPRALSLLPACEPVRLLAILDAAERALRASEQPAVPPVKQTPSYTVTTRPVGGWRLRCFDAAGVEVKGGAFDGGHSDADYLDAVEEGEAFLASLRGAEEINGASTATSEEAQVDGDRLADVGPAHVLQLTLDEGSVELLQRQLGLLAELAQRVPEVRERLLSIPDLAREVRFRQVDDLSAPAGQILFRLELSDTLRELAATCDAGDVDHSGQRVDVAASDLARFGCLGPV